MREEGASAVEYGLIVAAITMLVLGSIYGLGHGVATLFTTVNAQISSPAPSVPAWDPYTPPPSQAPGPTGTPSLSPSDSPSPSESPSMTTTSSAVD